MLGPHDYSLLLLPLALTSGALVSGSSRVLMLQTAVFWGQLWAGPQFSKALLSSHAIGNNAWKLPNIDGIQEAPLPSLMPPLLSSAETSSLSFILKVGFAQQLMSNG